MISRSDAIRFEGRSAAEFGVVLSVPATAVRVLPYLSLNRDDFVAGVLPPGEPPRRVVEPFEGSREMAFDLGRDARIVADDLDKGFAIVSDEGADDLRLGGQSATTRSSTRDCRSPPSSFRVAGAAGWVPRRGDATGTRSRPSARATARPAP